MSSQPRYPTRLLATEESGFLRELKAHADSKYNLDTAFRLRCIFFHIPKTAGVAVCDGLFGDRGPGHMDVEIAKVVFGEWRFQSFFKFCFVRNPGIGSSLHSIIFDTVVRTRQS